MPLNSDELQELTEQAQELADVALELARQVVAFVHQLDERTAKAYADEQEPDADERDEVAVGA